MRLTALGLVVVFVAPALAGDTPDRGARACKERFSDGRIAAECTRAVRGAELQAESILDECLDWYDEPSAALVCVRDDVLDVASPEAPPTACQIVFTDAGDQGKCMRALPNLPRGKTPWFRRAAASFARPRAGSAASRSLSTRATV